MDLILHFWDGSILTNCFKPSLRHFLCGTNTYTIRAFERASALFLLCSQLFIWQAHNALLMIRCLLKVFIREMSEEELHQQFSYQERAVVSSSGELEPLKFRQTNILYYYKWVRKSFNWWVKVWIKSVQCFILSWNS